MSVIRVNKNKDYTTMSNYHFKDKRITLKAKGLLSQMLSLPEDWDYSINGLVAINKENEGAIKGALDELKNYNYLIITKKMPNETESGRIEYVYDIYEKPKQEGKKQGVENQGVVFQGVENQGQYNTNNKITNNKNIKYNIYGEFENVKLTDEEYKKIEDKKLLSYIEDLSLYLKNHPRKKYASHYATILTWYRKENKNNGQNILENFDKNNKVEKISKEEQKELENILKEMESE